MKILAPTNTSREVELLIQNGAQELYCGFVPSEWDELSRTQLPLNKRDHEANVPTYSDLKKLVDIAHGLDVRVFLTVNASFYTQSQYSFLMEFIKKSHDDAGIDAFIISDMGLLLTIRDSNLDVEMHMSTIGSCFNPEIAKVYKEFGVTRIVLPRQLSIPEIREISQLVPDMQFELFILNGRCVYNDGFCMTDHKNGCFCTDNWDYYFFSTDGSKIPFKDNFKLRENLFHFESWHTPDKIIGDTGLPGRSRVVNTGCGLCAIPTFQDINISSLKIVGREFPTKLKIKSLNMLKKALDFSDCTQNEFLDRINDLQEDSDLCHSRYMCYYPDFMQN